MDATVTATLLPEVLIIQPAIHQDHRGYVFESFNQASFIKMTGIKSDFVQDNHSLSQRHVLRGLHCQVKHPQGKLIRVVEGTIFDVAVDIRPASPRFGQWVSVALSADNQKQLWVPAGFAHGFMTLSDQAQCLYKTTDYWYADDQCSIIWNDPDINVTWPNTTPILSTRDQQGISLQQWRHQHGS